MLNFDESGGTTLEIDTGKIIRLPLGLRQALESGDCVLFVGAGIGHHLVSPKGTTAPDGGGLADEIIRHFNLGIPSTDLPRVNWR
jgi:hypothetical protein